jgi:predicted DNA-binding transcriptional regulator AlpA
MEGTNLILVDERSLRKVISELFSEVITSKKEERNEEDEYLNLEQASQFLDLAKATIYGLNSNLGIPSVKRGKKLYFRRSDLIKWNNEGRPPLSNKLHSKVDASIANAKMKGRTYQPAKS